MLTVRKCGEIAWILRTIERKGFAVEISTDYVGRRALSLFSYLSYRNFIRHAIVNPGL